MKKFKYEILVILFFVLFRLPDIGHDNFTTDTWKWKSRSYDFGSGIFGLDFGKTLQKYHPGVTLMWIGTAGIKSYNGSYYLTRGLNPPDNDVSTIFSLDMVQKLLLVLVLGVGLAFVFYPIRKLFGLTTALFTAAAISFEPYYMALTRMFHLEGLLSIFMLASAVWLYWFITEGGQKKFILSAVFSGLAVLTKTSSLFLIPFTLMTLTLAVLSGNQVLVEISEAVSKKLQAVLVIKNIAVKFAFWLVVLALTVFALWPALWVAPKDVYKAVYRGVEVVGIEREHIQYYFGKLVDNPGATFYPVVFWFKISPWLLFGLFGLIFIFPKVSEKKKQFILFLLVYSLLYVLMLSIPTKKLDRYIMPSIISLVVISSFFYAWLWEYLNIKPVHKAVAFFFLLVTPIFILLACIHPDYLSYYNPFAGGIKNGIRVLEPKWLIGEREILDYFKKVRAAGQFQKSKGISLEGLIKEKTVKNILVVSFQEKYYTQIWPFFREIGAWAVIDDITAQARYAQYFVYPVWEDLSKNEDRFTLKYDGSVFIRGVEVYRVYKKD